MPDYKSMYYNLFNKVTDAIEAFQKAQQEAEEFFISGEDEPPIRLVDSPEE